MYPFNIAIIGSRFSGPSLDPDVQAYVNEVLGVGGTLSETEISAVNDLTIGLKTEGIWDLLDIFLPVLGSTAASCKINLLEPSNATYDWDYLGSLTFSSTGIKGNGIDGAVRSIWKHTDLVLSQSDDSHVHLYSKYFSGYVTPRLNGTLDTSDLPYLRVMASTNAGSSYGGMYTPETFLNKWSPDPDQFQGLMYCDTDGSTQRFFYSNTLRGSGNDSPVTVYATAGLALLGLYWSLYIEGQTSESVYVERSPDEIRSFSIGAKLTDNQKDSLYTLVTSYQTTLGRNI